MGQVSTPPAVASIILTAVDRLVAANADGGLAIGASHLILLGEDAGQNDVASEVIGLGWQALGGRGSGMVTTDLNGSVALGSRALADIRTPIAGGLVASNIAIGQNAAGLMRVGSANIVIGQNALGSLTGGALLDRGATRSVIIGDQAAGNILNASIANPRRDLVVIGYGAFNGGTADGQAISCLTSVIIGAFAYGAIQGVGNSHTQNVVIGFQAGQNYNCDPTGGGNNVLIGANAGINGTGGRHVAIGAGSVIGTTGGIEGCVALGQTAQATGASSIAVGTGSLSRAESTIAIGATADAPAGGDYSLVIGAQTVGANQPGNVRIGHGAGTGSNQAQAHRWILETSIAGAKRTVLFAFGGTTGTNIILGNSTEGVDRDTGGAGALNIVKLLNGAIGAANPVGGGYFYVAAGALHWVGSAGTDTVLAPA